MGVEYSIADMKGHRNLDLGKGRWFGVFALHFNDEVEVWARVRERGQVGLVRALELHGYDDPDLGPAIWKFLEESDWDVMMWSDAGGDGPWWNWPVVWSRYGEP